MICPFRINKIHTCHDGKTWIYEEFGECYKEGCPYWGKLEYPQCDTEYGCRKAEKECYKWIGR